MVDIDYPEIFRLTMQHNSTPDKGRNLSPLAIAAFALLELLVLSQALLAYRDEILTVAQMRHRGVSQGLPFVWHFAMWTDLALISPLAAYLVNRYWKAWTFLAFFVSLAVGFAASGALHYLYTFSTVLETHIQNHALTPAGYVHLIYMAISFSIFLQFFLFTDLTHKALVVVSAVLLLHVFIGTHMVLGILNLYFPQDWYPGQPLKSIIGWTTLVSLGVGLLWCNYYQIDRANWWIAIERFPGQHPIGRKLITTFEFWSLSNFDTTERFLKSLDYIASYVGVSAFTGVFLAKLQISTEFRGGIFHLENWIFFIKNTALPSFLILLFGTIYMLGRHSVRLELALGNKLFPVGHVPTGWGTPKTRVLVFITVIMHLVLYLSLTWFADNILVASLIMFVTTVNDWRTRYLIENGVKAYFDDDKYAPKREETDYQLIMDRREVALRFLNKPHLTKESLRIVGCGLAFGLALYGYGYGSTEHNFAAYIALIATLIINEVVTMKWRIKMYFEMESLDEKKALAVG